MRLADPKTWIGILSAGAVLYLAFGDLARRDPGPLAAVHQRVPELAGRLHCSKCHGGWWVSMTEACLDCHDTIDEQIQQSTGLHGSLDSNKAMLCVLCHSDHHGEDFAIVNRQSFVLAEIADPGAFDHNLIGFEMDGSHLELTCNECHQNADAAVLPEGEARFLGLDQDCSSCHDTPHSDRFQLACVQCHSQQAFDQLASRGHEEHLDLIGGHAELNCEECHAPDGSHSLEAMGQRWRVERRECLDCHGSLHDQEFLAKVAELETSTIGSSCVSCHRAEHNTFRDPALEMSPAQHAETGFTLDHPHDQTSCEQCHAEDAIDFVDRFPGRKPDECRRCHEDPHAGQFDHEPYETDGCIACHDRQHFDPHDFDADMHAQAPFVLTGSHLDTECRVCHELPAAGEPRTFNGTPAKCDGCHADAHLGFFDKFDVLDGVVLGTCAPCHLTTSFSESPDHAFDHEQWTGFPVEGAHEQDGCQICHPRSAEPNDRGRTLGRVSEHFGTFEGCQTCHQNPHEDEFSGARFPLEIEGRSGCARCHSQISFRTFPEGFDHQLWTGFDLQGVHKDTGCSSCHEPLAEPTAHGRTWGRAIGNQCADCHQDPHGGQFVSGGRNDCRRCHRSAVSFAALSFNHSIHSRFLLGEAHEDLACSTCHKQSTEGELEFVRYRPLKTDCVDCHGKQNGPLRRRGKK